MDKTKTGILILRIGLAAVFLWFGITQLMDPSVWTGLIPQWLTSLSGMSAGTVVVINGIAEIVLALALLGNFSTPVVALLLTLHLISIAITLGYNAVAVRDIGLAFMALSLTVLTWDRVFKKQNVNDDSV